MTPIPTTYRGVTYRSRVEARWAVFFEAMGWPAVYEQQGLDLDGVWYLPDFWLPNFRWIMMAPISIYSAIVLARLVASGQPVRGSETAITVNLAKAVVFLADELARVEAEHVNCRSSNGGCS